MSKSINDWVKEVHANAYDKGFWDKYVTSVTDLGGPKPDLSVDVKLSKIALMVSELSEAVEEIRKDVPSIYQRYLPTQEDQDNSMELEFNGKTVLVDKRDYEKVKHFGWYLSHDGNAFYMKTNLRGTSTSYHNMILKPEKGLMVDHINGDTLNNLRSNLRICSPSQNQANQKIQNRLKSSEFKGVSFNKPTNKWKAQLGFGGKRLSLGYYSSEEEAAKAYDKVAKELFGNFARLNFPVKEEIEILVTPDDPRWNENIKSEGELIELADCVIRIFDYCGYMGYNLEEAIRIKHKYNTSRPYMHGKKA